MVLAALSRLLEVGMPVVAVLGARPASTCWARALARPESRARLAVIQGPGVGLEADTSPLLTPWPLRAGRALTSGFSAG